MNKKSLLIGIVVVVVAGILAASYLTTASQPAIENVSWGFVPDAAEPIVVMKAKGLPEKHRLNVNFVEFTDFRPKNTAFYGGQTDIDAGVNPVDLSAVYQEGRPVKSVAMSRLYREPSNVFVVPKASPIQSLGDLKGKKIGIPGETSLPGLLLRDILATKYGIDTTKDLEVVRPPPNLVAELVDKGEIHGGLVQTTRGTVLAVASGKYRVLYDVATDWIKVYGSDPVTSTLAIQRKITDEKPDVARRIVSMWKEAVDYINKNPNDMLFEELATKFGYTTPQLRALYEEQTLKSYVYRMDDGIINSVKENIKLSIKYKLRTSMPDDGWFTKDYLR